MSFVKYEKDGAIGIITMNRPEVLNALSFDVVYELSDIISEIEKDPDIRALIATGEGRGFVAGADIPQFQNMTMEIARSWSSLGKDVLRRIELLEIPTIAAVNGFAFGGGLEMALAFDIIVASEKAKFALPEVGLGIMPGFSGTQRLPRKIGIGRAKEIIFSGDPVDANRALEIGLAEYVVAPEELMDKAKELCMRFIKNAPVSLKMSKVAINRGMQMDIDDAIDFEVDCAMITFMTEDSTEGISAFVEKRKPNFKGK